MSQKATGSETTQRYETVVLAIEWMRIMQGLVEFKDLSHSELVKKAADDVSRKLITEADIAKYRKTAPAVAAPVEKKIATVIIEEEEEKEVKKTKKKK
ncbi:MAG: hypothetical protein NTU66_01540 [Elusimicrobia bacterium]|nr:hypothetical protein [Elusimicrobiota bacterium]